MVFGPSVGNNRSGSLLELVVSWLKQRFTGGNMFNKKKAFTLSELLVVVIVLGVLAAVAVPKFTRVLETRKTTEAEGMLSAVRTEQEKRCTLGDEYSVKFASLPVAASLQRSTEREAKSANYTYTLNGSGMQAQSSGKDYTIKMLSYKDGGLCCEGSFCNQLNKSYPSCGGVPADECAVRIPCSGSSSRSCGCQNTGTQYRSCDENTGSWGAWGSCSVGACKSCSASGKPAASQSCGCQNTGTQSRTVTCDPFTGTWQTGAWGSCSVGACKSCTGTKPASSQSCGNCGTQTRSVSCDPFTGTWKTGSWSSCTGQGVCSPGATQSQSCAAGYSGSQKRTCSSSCQWGGWDSSGCVKTQECTPGATQTGSSCGNCGTQKRTCSSSGKWGSWVCSGQGTCSPGTKQSRKCTSGTGTQTRTCSSSCSWGSWTGFCKADPPKKQGVWNCYVDAGCKQQASQGSAAPLCIWVQGNSCDFSLSQCCNTLGQRCFCQSKSGAAPSI